MRILQVNLNGEGGAFSLIYQMQQQLLTEFIFDFYWMGKFCDNKFTNELKRNGCRFFEANIRKNRFIGHLLTPFLFYKFLKNNHYDIVHINADTAFKHIIYAKSAKKAGCKRVIIHSHSSGINGKFKFLKFFLHCVSRPFLLKNSDIYISCSKLASDWMFKSDDRKVFMIKNGVDTDKFAFSLKERKIYRDKINANERIVIGMVGNLSYQKNPEFLISILSFLPTKKYLVVFIGDGPNRKNIETLVHKKRLEESVIFYGQSPDVDKLLNSLDLFVMPSRFEGLPVSGVEAQVNGIKCIFSDKITPEIRLLPTSEILTLSNIQKWIDVIKNVKNFERFENAAEYVSKLGFNIHDSAKILSQIYKDENI